MADAYLKEDASGRYLLEDGSGVYLLEQNDTPLTPSVGSLTLTGLAGRLDLAITPLSGQLKAVGELPVLGPQTLIIRGQSPSLILGTVCQPAIGSLVLNSDAGTIQGGSVLDTPITPTVGALVLASDAGAVFLETFCIPSVGALVLTGTTPPLDMAVIPTAGALVLTGRRGSIPGLTTMHRLLLMRVG